MAVVAASAVLYHSVATLYAAVMLALVAVIALPYLLLQHQRRVAQGPAADACARRRSLAVCYAALTYNLAGLVTGHSLHLDRGFLTLGSQWPRPRGTCWRRSALRSSGSGCSARVRSPSGARYLAGPRRCSRPSRCCCGAW